jgi:DNA repair protein SbcC/Rad50
MRPVVLEMEGFGAFRTRTEVHFDDTDFFALVGPTGSGKSTVIDAICFALYGSVPRYDNKNLVGQAMSVGHNETKVRLTFEVGGERYIAFRWVRRGKDGRVTTREARLEGPDGLPLVDRARDLDARIEALIGLPFDHFTRCVVLPQGAFARFLHDPPSKRQELLVQLLELGIYDRMATAANQRARTAAAEVTAGRTRLADMADVTEDAVATADAAVQAAHQRTARLDELMPVLDAAEALVVARSDALTRTEGLLDGLRAVGVPDDARQRGAVAQAADEALLAAETDMVAAQVLADAAAETLAALPNRGSLDVALAAHRQLTAARADLLQATQGAAAAAVADEQANADLAAAEAVAVQTAAAMEAAQSANAAYTVLRHLHDGDDCPVCGQLVATVPEPVTPPDWEAAQARVATAETAVAKARQRSTATGRQLAAAQQRATSDGERVAALVEAVAASPPFDQLGHLVAAVDEAAAADSAARQNVKRAALVVTDRRADAGAARQAVAEVGERFYAQRDLVIALGPPAPGADLLAAWQSLEVWARGHMTDQRARLLVQQREVDEAREQRATHRLALDDVAEQAGLPRGADGYRVRGALAKAEADSAARLGHLREQLAEVARLGEVVARAETDAKVATLLGQLLSANGFEKWLVAEALDALVTGAADTLLALSGRQYTLVTDDSGDFVVVDHANGDERRPVRTLSGGETFQAALALSLALADHLAGLSVGGSAKLEAMFLDEGFGTLDAESLDTVASTIEALGASGRMVGIVTHVRELAARVPVRYEVRKEPRSSTVTRVVT